MARQKAPSDSDGGEVGVVLAVTPSGSLTARVRPGSELSEGVTVRDRTGKFRGRVVRVFGPVDRPYLAIRLRRNPAPNEGVALIGASLWREQR